MWSIRSFASNAALASSLFLAATMLPADVQALPQCGPAVPAEVGVAKLYAYNSWQSYQTSSPEDRCCAKPCLAFGEYAGALEKNADALNRTARDPKVPAAERKVALDAFNLVSKKRTDVTFQFLQCFAQGRVKGAGATRRCGTILFTDRELAWAKVCTGYAQRVAALDSLLIRNVGNNVGTWQVQTNWFRFDSGGGAELNSIFIAPTTRLPPGQTATPYKNFIGKTLLGSLPDQQRMYMRMTARVVRAPGPAGTKAVPASALIDGPCPGPINRPAN